MSNHSIVRQLLDQDSDRDIDRQIFPRLLDLVTDALDQNRNDLKVIEKFRSVPIELSEEPDQSFEGYS